MYPIELVWQKTAETYWCCSVGRHRSGVVVQSLKHPFSSSSLPYKMSPSLCGGHRGLWLLFKSYPTCTNLHWCSVTCSPPDVSAVALSQGTVFNLNVSCGVFSVSRTVKIRWFSPKHMVVLTNMLQSCTPYDSLLPRKQSHLWIFAKSSLLSSLSSFIVQWGNPSP